MTDIRGGYRRSDRYEIVDSRKYRHAVAVLSNGQRTARWSQNKTTGQWYVSKGWGRANLSQPLDTRDSAAVEQLVAGTPTS